MEIHNTFGLGAIPVCTPVNVASIIIASSLLRNVIVIRVYKFHCWMTVTHTLVMIMISTVYRDFILKNRGNKREKLLASYSTELRTNDIGYIFRNIYVGKIAMFWCNSIHWNAYLLH